MVTVPAARAAAVQTTWKTLADILGPDRYRAEQVVDALARAGLIVVDPQRVAALEEVAAVARHALAVLDLIARPGAAFTEWPTGAEGELRARKRSAGEAADRLRAALDAVPEASTTSEE